GDGSVRYGGPEASELLDPGEWLSVADAYARNVPADTAALTSEGLHTAKSMLNRAAAAIDEGLKFIPPAAARVPERAFVTDRGRAAYGKEPGRFRRARLEAVRSTYANIAGQL